MKVFSKANKNNKSTPLLQSLNYKAPAKPVNKPRGIAKVTSYKNKLMQSSKQASTQPVIPINHSSQYPEQYPPTTQRSKLDVTHGWRAQRSVDVGTHNHYLTSTPVLVNSISYKTCKSQAGNRSSNGSIDKIENAMSYATKLGKENKYDKSNQNKSTNQGSCKTKAKPITTFNFVTSSTPFSASNNMVYSCQTLPSNDDSFHLKLAKHEPANCIDRSSYNQKELSGKENSQVNTVKGEEEPSKKKINHYKNTRLNQYKLKPLEKEKVQKWSLSRFKMGKKLGRGRFGSVFIAEQKSTGMVVALKLIDWLQVKQEQMESQIMEEIKLQLFMNHPNILKMYGCFREGNQLCMVLEYADQKCLFGKLDSKMEQKEAAYYTRQMIEALKYCHSQSILHRDLKPENILLCQGVAKLADFGWAAYAPKYKRSTFCGTLDYVPPEILQGKYYDQKVDIWSLGVLIYEMSTGKAPFETYSVSQAHVQSKTMTRILDGDLSIPQNLSPVLRKLIESILMTEPQKRPSLAQIESNTWIQNYKQEGVQISRSIWDFWIQQSQQ